jgi:hypothetical protein
MSPPVAPVPVERTIQSNRCKSNLFGYRYPSASIRTLPRIDRRGVFRKPMFLSIFYPEGILKKVPKLLVECQFAPRLYPCHLMAVHSIP